MFDTNSLQTMFLSLDNSDIVATVIFLVVACGYRLFLLLMSKYKRNKLTLSVLQEYRLAWIKTNGNNKNPIIIVQTLRNSLTTASFFASTSILLIGASVTIFNSLFPDIEASSSLLVIPEYEKIMTVKILLIISTLSYVFLHFTWYIREIHNIAYMLTLPFEIIEESVDKKAHEHTANLLEQAGYHYSLGIRGYFFAIALFLWFFGNSLLYLSLLLIIGSLLKRDLRAMGNH
jgi:uncharacterized membrane protein